MTVEDSQEKKFILLLSRKLKNKDISADINALNPEERAAFKAWIRQAKHKAEADIWHRKQKQRAKDFAQKFGTSYQAE